MTHWWRLSGTCGTAGPASWPGAGLTRAPQGGCAMRKPLLSLAVVALVASACGTAAAPTNGQYVAPPPQHHDQQPPPVQEGPPATPYGGGTQQNPGLTPHRPPPPDR